MWERNACNLLTHWVYTYTLVVQLDKLSKLLWGVLIGGKCEQAPHLIVGRSVFDGVPVCTCVQVEHNGHARGTRARRHTRQKEQDNNSLGETQECTRSGSLGYIQTRQREPVGEVAWA